MKHFSVGLLNGSDEVAYRNYCQISIGDFEDSDTAIAALRRLLPLTFPKVEGETATATGFGLWADDKLLWNSRLTPAISLAVGITPQIALIEGWPLRSPQAA